MRHFARTLVVAAALGFLRAGVAWSTPLSDAEHAFDRGDWSLARQLLTPLADKGSPLAQAYLGEMYALGQGQPQNLALGRALLEKSADQDEPNAEFMLGSLYGGSFGTQQDDAKAIRWYRKAAEHDDTEAGAYAQYALGQLYQTGKAESRNSSEAARWLNRAAMNLKKLTTQGNVRAKTILASMYLRGEGVPTDHEQSSRLYMEVANEYRINADRGDAYSQHKLAALYQHGDGVQKSKLQAAIWYRRSADQGYAPAQLNLGFLYNLTGISGWLFDMPDDVEPDARVAAYVWLSLGEANSASTLTPELDDIRAQVRTSLSPAQTTEADRQIRDWRPVKETPRIDGTPIEMTPAQATEATRLAREWEPTPAQIEEAENAAHVFDMTLGSPAAPIVVVEYTSPSAPHSAVFNNEDFPAFKAKYIDTGIVKFVVREFVTPPTTIAIDGVLIARCAGADKYFTVLDDIYRNQAAMYRSEVPHDGLLEIARTEGLSESQISQCLSDEVARKALRARVKTFGAYDHIVGAPTFVVGGQVLEGRQSAERLSAAVDRARGFPPAPDPNATRILRHPGFFMRVVDGEASSDATQRPPKLGDERISQADGPDLWLRAGSVVTGRMIKEAQADTDLYGRPAISYQLTDEGQRRFAEFTTKHVGDRLALIWNDEVLSAPTIIEPITGGQGEITGEFTAQTAQDLANALSQKAKP